VRIATWWNSAVILLLRSALWTLLLPGLIAGYVPWQFFGFRVNDLSGATDALGVVVLLFGVIVLTLCIVEFALRGSGTLSPLDPPRQLVVTGLYRWVRNPMYVGVAFILIGEVLIARSNSLALYTLTFVICTTLFIVGFEEPYLERSFGLSYADYKRHVRRWIPRLTPWNPREHSDQPPELRAESRSTPDVPRTRRR
jgi:protein-S-isoprenylcysteine O-methyltransferase Ste14